MTTHLHRRDCDCMSCSRCDCYRCARLRALSRRYGPPGPSDVGELAKMVSHLVLSARNIEEVDYAERVLRQYLRLVPDSPIRLVGEQLGMMRDALRLITDGRGAESDPSKRHLP